MDPSKLVAARVRRLQRAVPKDQKGRITMAVAVAQDSAGEQIILVGTSEPGGYLRPGGTLKTGETLVTGTEHAEVNIVNYAFLNGLRLIDIGATRPICVPCQDAILPTGATMSTSLRPRP